MALLSRISTSHNYEVSASLRDDERFPPARDAKVILCDVSKMALLSHIPYYC